MKKSLLGLLLGHFGENPERYFLDTLSYIEIFGGFGEVLAGFRDLKGSARRLLSPVVRIGRKSLILALGTTEDQREPGKDALVNLSFPRFDMEKPKCWSSKFLFCLL